MLYTGAELRHTDFDHKRAMTRYLHKYLNQKKEFHCLKTHEKDYVFGWMQVTYNEDGTTAFNLYEEKEAKEYIFFNIILTYGEDVDKFEGPIYGPSGELSKEQITKDSIFFYEYIEIWKRQIAEHKGPYLSIIAPMLRQKLKELLSICSSEEEYTSREVYCYSVFFYIYYKAKLLFEDNRKKGLIFKIRGFDFVINIYTFCHIFTRHYVPSLNRGLANTMNSDIAYIDINKFAESLGTLIKLYFSKVTNLDENTEFLLFRFTNEPYILWIKYKIIDELGKNKGFEVRSFYKCEQEIDIQRFNHKAEIKLANKCFCYV